MYIECQSVHGLLPYLQILQITGMYILACRIIIIVCQNLDVYDKKICCVH